MEEIKNIVHSFMDKLIDWKEFELFVADMYRNSEEVTVQHNVTLIGKSLAKRQIDVLVTQKTKLHTLKILIECKFWKDKIDRSVVDVLAAAIDDLSAAKGVIFTTKGYEAGAIEFAKNKNIDIFLIRDVYEDEWGNPGRFILLYLQIFSSNITNLSFGNPRFISSNGKQPSNQHISLQVVFKENMEFDESHQLYSITGEKGPHLVKTMLGIRDETLKNLVKYYTSLIKPETTNHELFFKTPVTINFEKTSFRYFKIPDGLVMIDTLHFDLLQSVSQSRFQIDRAGSSDFVLMVENYVTKQRNFVSRAKEDRKVLLSKELKDSKALVDEKPFQNGSVMKITTDFFVVINVDPGTKIVETNSVHIEFQAPL